jgi:hypothetical protein
MKVAIHLGLGDAIVCAPIIAKLAQENDVVEIPCWKHNEVSVRSFFVNYPNVEVVEVSDDFLADADLKLGSYNKDLPQQPDEDFVQWFYRQAGMDVSEKDKYCPIREAAMAAGQIPANLLRYQFVHFNFDRPLIHLGRCSKSLATIFPNDKERSILSYRYILLNAREIHCIDSSFLHLVECLPTTGKLFYHKYARPDSPDYNYLKKEWEVLT